MLLLDIELKKKYITGSGKLSKRHLGGLNSYTDCEQVFNGLKQNEEEEKKDAKQEKEKPSKKRAEEDIKQMKERGGNASTKKKASGESSRKITMKRKIEDEVTPNNSFTDMMAHLKKLKEDILKEVKENISPVHPAPPDQSGN